MRLSNWFTGFITGLLLGYWFRGKRMQARAVTNPVFAARVLPPCGYLGQPHDPQDVARVEFLRCLADARVQFTDWEAQFIESNLGRAWFTEKQKAVIDRLRTKYQSGSEAGDLATEPRESPATGNPSDARPDSAAVPPKLNCFPASL